MQRKHGFTIVELVIVIAVIAILSAVLIPTFGGIIDSANRAADTQLVAQINTILTIEDILGGGVNDAVEIQKIIKDNGLKLQTKTKGQYIWYDIENKQAVLGGLDENGIVLEGAAAEPALVAEGVVSSKGKFRAIVNSPESFVNGYLFISTESADGFAQDICALRNSDSVDAIQNALANISKVNSALGVKLTNFMKTAAVITGNGSVISIGDASTVKTAIVNSELTHVESSTITALSQYTGIQVVDFHSGVASFGEGVMDAIKALNDTKFCYSNTGVEEIDKADEAATGIKNNLISPTERDELFKKLNLVYIDQNGVQFNEEKNIDQIEVSDDFITTFDFPYVIVASNDINAAYDFVSYSFYSDGSNPIPSGTTNYKIEDYDKILSDEESGTLTIYAVYNKQAADFKIGNSYYGSETVTYMLDSKLITSGTITVVSTTATLGDDTHNEIIIPSGVELLLPYKSDFTKGAGTAAVTNVSSFVEMDFANGSGATQLTIPTSVTLVNQGTIHVDACLYNYATSVQAFIKENECGVLVVNGTVTSTGNITAFGVIRGSGSIAANNGTITETMTIYDWYGGTNAATAVGIGSTLAGLAKIAGYDFYGKNTIPFHNWRIQNIQIPVTMQSNTTYKAASVIDINSTPVPADFALAGPSASIFVMNSGAEIIRTISDDGDAKFIVTKGTVQDSPQKLTLNNVVNVSGLGSISATIDFTKICLPLSHFDVDVEGEAILNVSSNIYMLMPGSDIMVDSDAVLNIGTKVVFCNSYDLKFDEDNDKPGSSYEKINDSEAWEIAYILSEDRGCYEAWKYKCTANGTDCDGTVWERTGEAPVRDAAKDFKSPHVYPVNTPAELIIRGTLNFNAGAAFAGKIISDDANAKIVASVTVGGCTLPEGFVSNKVWQYTYAGGLYQQAVLVGTTQTDIAAGTYKYVSTTENGVTVSGWFKQP